MLKDGKGAVPPPTRRRFLGAAAGAAAAAASTPLLSGCGGSAKADGKRLTFWNFYGPQKNPDPAVNAQAKWFTDLVAEWNATHEVKVDLVFVPTGDYTNGFKVPSAFATGSGPDIFLLSPGDFLRYSNGGVLQDLTPHLDDGVVEDYGDVLNSRMVDGKVYALPMEVEPLAMLYDVGAWEKAGLSEADIPTTWDQLLDTGDKLSTRTRAGFVVETNPGYLQNFMWYPWLWQGGGDVVDAGGTVVFDSKAARQALQLWGDAVRHGIMPRTLPAAGDVVSAFKTGNVGMWQMGIWQVSSFKAYAPKFKYGIFRLPVPPGGKYTTALGGWSFAANAKGGNPEQAAEFCGWALGRTDERCVDRMVQWCTGVKSDIAPRTSAVERGAEKGGYDFWAMKKFKDDIAPEGRAEPRFPPVVYKAVSDAVQGVMFADKGVDGAVTRAAESIEAFMKSYQGASLI
ncbi:sugar ABC transporter substrate-binding protein [Streptomyces triticagri]|uniref:Sugar ABC transporter substrate-binding protein n=1 Tax=Streptomyces triticagri TaxID=2293568 RepID=A0A372LW99_9ACTN|nr:sugar ABC transporter substrate-binding protein [Streptomyces triticagri]RFU82297.1 sugar ABC transporter substrate-binding protein [Streptomyces triticagri]